MGIGGLLGAVGLGNPVAALGTVLGGGSNLLGGWMQNNANKEMAREATQANKEMAQDQMKFQERMSNSAYQRSMADMKKAGLNPMLAFSQGGASSPAGASGSAVAGHAENIMKDLSTTALDSMRLRKEMKAVDSQTDLNEATKAAAVQQAKLTETSAKKVGKEVEALEASLPAIRASSALNTKRDSLDTKAVEYDFWSRRAGEGLGHLNKAKDLINPLGGAKGKTGNFLMNNKGEIIHEFRPFR